MEAAPLHSWTPLRRTWLNRVFALLYSSAILALLYHHFLNLTHHYHSNNTTTSLALLLADSVLAFIWVTCLGFRVRPIRRETFPENLPRHVKESDYPAVDVLICTADPHKEPPMRVVNTALSVMAYDYPTEKLSVYVSDDGGSQLTLFAFMEASKFAGHWLPFCRKNRIVKRCPQAYFASEPACFSDSDQIKNMYESMKTRVERVVERGSVPSDYITNEKELQVFSKWTDGFTPQHHPTVIQVGFRYGSLAEDFYTGYSLHCEGWRSIFCHSKRAAFLGDVPHDVLNQIMRWSMGLLEVAFCKNSPITLGFQSLNPFMALCYAHYAFWPIWGIPITIYAFLPQLALLNSVSIFPKVSDPWFFPYAFLFLGSYAQDFIEFMLARGTIRRWWNTQRMWLLRGLSSFPFGLVEYLFKSLGTATFVFNVTSKVVDNEQGKRYEEGIFEFGVASPLFLPVTMAAIINLVSFVIGIIQVFNNGSRFEDLFVQMFIAGFAVANSWPVYEAMVLRTDKGKMPMKITLTSLVLAWFLYLASSLAF